MDYFTYGGKEVKYLAKLLKGTNVKGDRGGAVG